MKLDMFEYTELKNVMTALKHREYLMQLKIINSPNMKKDARQKLYTQIEKAANPQRQKRALTINDLDRMLNG